MPIVSVSKVISADADAVWKLITGVEDYPRLMIGTVQDLVIEKRTDDGFITSWTVLLRGNLLSWRQEEYHDASLHSIYYRQLDGDLERISGSWIITPHKDGVLVELTVDFEIGIPMLRDVLNPIAESALRENCEAMLNSLEMPIQ
jgi:ribosome-associated toxin RatA of RatAB toxin-antitoxin module